MSPCTIAAAVAMIAFITIAEGQSPILLVPGLMGSQLYYRTEPCDKRASCPWKGLWLPKLDELGNDALKLVDNLKLEYNEASNTYHNKSGVGITAAGFGITCRVEYLLATSPQEKCGERNQNFSIYEDFVNYFVENVGYKRDRNIRAAPYDWRLTPVQHEQMGYYSSVKKLIEKMYKDNGNTRVTLVVHSMGGPVTLYFLNNIVDQDWKDTYIHAFVPLAGAWSGGNQILQALISGLNISEASGNEIPDPYGFKNRMVKRIIKSTSRTLPGALLMLPNADVWKKGEVLVTTGSKSYTANDYEALFRDMEHPVGFTMYSNGISDINAGYPDPKVPTYCYYGTGIPTPERFDYNKGFNKDPSIIYGPGDGTVNLKSLKVCLSWADENDRFESREFEGVDHKEIQSNTDVLSAVKEIVTSI